MSHKCCFETFIKRLETTFFSRRLRDRTTVVGVCRKNDHPETQREEKTEGEEDLASSTSATKYTVTSGDTLSGLAERFYGNSNLWNIIYEANKHVIGSDPNLLRVGEVLTIPLLPPTPGAYYTVQPNDTLSSIAERAYGDASKWQVIYDANRGTIGSNPNIIQSGQRIYIPTLS